MSTSIKTPDENPSNVESILSDMNGLPGYTIDPPGSRIETLLIMMNGAFASSIVASIDENFVMSITLKNNKGETIGTTQTIDLPLESVIVNGSYDSTNKKLVFVLENGNTIDVPIGDLISGLQEEITTTNKLNADLVDDSTSTNKFNVQADWNQTTDTASDYIKNKPTLGTAAALDVATSGDASISEVVKGDDTRLTDSRNAADVYSWAKEANKPSYTGSEITLTGYAEAQSKASVAATDTTNAAVGKLEYRVETNETNISNIQQVPSVGSSDNGKVLTATYENGEGTYAWQGAGGGGTAKYLYQLTVGWGCRTMSAPILGYTLRFCVSFVSDDGNLAVTGTVDYNTFITKYIKFSNNTGYAWAVNVNSVFISDGSSGAIASFPVSTVRINWDNGHWLFRTSDGEMELEKGVGNPNVFGTKTEI